MNIINRLTLRHLKENKRRTLVTIIGVIISVAMVTAVSTLGVSFLDLMKRQTIATDGEWHVQYKNVNKDQIEAIQKDENTQKVILTNNGKYARLKESENENKPYLYIKEYSEKGLTQFPIELKKGRLPKSENEVVISEEIINDAGVNYKIGDSITIEMGERYLENEVEPLLQNYDVQRDEEGKTSETLKIQETKTFTIVGMIKRPKWEPSWAPGYTVINFLDPSTLNGEEQVNALVVLNKVSNTLFKQTEKLAKENHVKAFSFNEELLRYYGVTGNGNLKITLNSLLGIIMGVIIIGSVSLIYNAFAISVSERSRHLGMLASVGATKKQKRNSVFFEGAFIGAISIPLGLLAGLGGIGITFMFINSFIEEALLITERLKLIITPFSLLTACLVSILTIFISTYLPARKASKISPIEAIRQTQDIKLTSKAVKTSKIIRKLFGLEAEIGLKNLKRNKRRYKATVFSLVISIVLFLSVSFFTESLKKTLVLSQDDVNFDINVSLDLSSDEKELNVISHLANVTDYTLDKSLELNTKLEQSEIADSLQELVKKDQTLLENGKYTYYVVLHALDDQSFKDYAKKVGVDFKEYNQPQKPKAIAIGKIKYQDMETGKIIETKSINIEKGKTLELLSMDYETGAFNKVHQVQVGTITEELPMGSYRAGLGGMELVMTMDTLNQLVNKEVKNPINDNIYLKSSDPMETQKALEDMKKSNMYVYNVFQEREREEQMVLLMSVFTYGFIALISLISIANIFNTISTSISLRKREFAMLKSVGMTSKGFNKMINYESIFYGIKALLYGIPISVIVMGFIYWAMRKTFEYGFEIPWLSFIYVIIAIFLIVGSAMLYSISKIKKENIIDGLKQENI